MTKNEGGGERGIRGKHVRGAWPYGWRSQKRFVKTNIKEMCTEAIQGKRKIEAEVANRAPKKFFFIIFFVRLSESRDF